MRQATIRRTTKETDVSIDLTIEGSGRSEIDTGCGFLDHMLTLFASHGRFDLIVKCKGDTEVDDHHTVEDVGIALGEAFFKALGDKAGIARYGSTILPMDEALILSAVDFSGRDYLGYDLFIPTEKVGSFDTELAEEFWLSLVRNAKITLHFLQFAGENSHHILEGSFKSAARSFKQALTIDPSLEGAIPSTKGTL